MTPGYECVRLVTVKSNAAFIRQVKIFKMSIRVRGAVQESRRRSGLWPQDTELESSLFCPVLSLVPMRNSIEGLMTLNSKYFNPPFFPTLL